MPSPPQEVCTLLLATHLLGDYLNLVNWLGFAVCLLGIALHVGLKAQGARGMVAGGKGGAEQMEGWAGWGGVKPPPSRMEGAKVLPGFLCPWGCLTRALPLPRTGPKATNLGKEASEVELPLLLRHQEEEAEGDP